MKKSQKTFSRAILIFIGVCIVLAGSFLFFYLKQSFHTDSINNFNGKQANYMFSKTLAINPVNSYRPNADNIPYFCITKEKFGVSLDTTGKKISERHPFFLNPLYKKVNFSEDFFKEELIVSNFFKPFESIEMISVLNQDKTESGYFLLLADENILVAYNPGTPKGWVIQLSPIHD